MYKTLEGQFMGDKKIFLKHLIRNTSVIGIAMVIASVGTYYFGGLLKLKHMSADSLPALALNLFGYTLVLGFIYTYQFQRDQVTILTSDKGKQELLQRVLKKYKFKLKESENTSHVVYQSNMLNHLLMGRVTVERVGNAMKLTGPKCVTIPFKK